MARRRNWTPLEQEHRIVHMFAEDIRKSDDEVWYTVHQIAKKLDLSASTYLRGIINGMVFKGTLVARVVSKPGRWSGYEYALTPGTYQRPPKRHIKINGRNLAKEQLQLWNE